MKKSKLDNQQKKEIMEWINNGLTNKAISKEFSISPQQVSGYIKRFRDYKEAINMEHILHKIIIKNRYIIANFEAQFGDIFSGD